MINWNKFAVWIFNKIICYSFFFKMRIFWLKTFGNRFGECVSIHRKVYFMDFGGLCFGSNITINYGCLLDNRLGIFIGDNVNISHNVKIYTMGHNIDDPYFSVSGGPVNIMNNVWIFPNSIIMPNVTLAEGTVVLPGSVVAKNTEPYSVVAGVPAKKIRERKKDVRYKIKYPVWFAV